MENFQQKPDESQKNPSPSLESQQERQKLEEFKQAIEYHLTMLYALPIKEKKTDEIYLKKENETPSDFKAPETKTESAVAIKTEAPKQDTASSSSGTAIESSTTSVEQKYNIIYVNPELGKPEVVETTSLLKFQSIEQKTIEESLAARDQNQALEYIVKELLEKSQKKENIKPENIAETLKKRDKVVGKIQQEIDNLDKALKEAQKAKDEKELREKVFPLLSPLTRKRMEALLKEKKQKELVHNMLVAEHFFLEKMKFLFTAITPNEIKGFLNSLAKLVKK